MKLILLGLFIVALFKPRLLPHVFQWVGATITMLVNLSILFVMALPFIVIILIIF